MSKDRCGRFKEPLQFGHENYVVALRERLEEHFEEPGEEPALVAGLFGEWGCGKTAWLRRLEFLFEKEIREKPDGKDSDGKETGDKKSGDSITVPVFFNAWRFEKEEHLIVPLLKTAQETLAGYGQKGSVGEWLKDKAELMGEVVAAVAHGLKGKLSVPFVAELEVDPGAVLDYAMQAAKKSQEKQSAVIDRYASIYFDLVGFLETLTGRPKFRARRNWEKQENGRKKCGWLKKRFGKDEERKDKTTKWKKLNLLFLIDDLDRCLPEKAVEMLEAIKLFLEVEGCAFVLGIDDEVVDRGILHRYKDYNLAKIASGKNGGKNGGTDAANGTEAPITGSEYLEKIIHLPLRVPPPGAVEVREFLSRWGQRFFRQSGETGEMTADTEGAKLPKAKKMGGEEDRSRGAEDPLLKKLAGLIPPVPRKIVRAGELLCLLAGVNDSEKGARIDRETLALLGLIQLFAPALYRRLRRNPSDLLTLCQEWPKQDQAGKAWESPEALARWLKKMEDGWDAEKDAAELNNLHRRWKPLADVLAEVAAPRSGFDVYKVLNEIRISAGAEVSDLRPWFALVELEGEKKVPAKPGDEAVALESRPDQRAIASLQRADRFLEAFGVRDSGAWAAAVEAESEALRGKRLAVVEVERLLKIAAEPVSGWDSETRARWLATLKPWVGEEDFGKLQKAAKWQDAEKELGREDVEPKVRNAALSLLDAVAPRRGTGLDADGLPDIEWMEIPEKSRRFMMGASKKESEEKPYGDERPQHEVVLSKGFEIARYPVTRTQFGVFLAEGAWKNERWWSPDKGWGVGDDALEWRRSAEGGELGDLRGEGSEPVVGVTWYAAMAYCRWLSTLRSDSILLPTEAQWECAVRAADPMAGEVYPWGSGEEARRLLPRNANMDESGIGEPSVVGAFSGGQVKLADDRVIDDLIGNVWEWCRDGRRKYPEKPGNEVQEDPLGPMQPGSGRALRGGSYWDNARDCRCAYRYAPPPGDRRDNFGFRLVRLFRQAGPPEAGGPARSEAEAGQGAPRDAGKDLPGASEEV